MTSPTSSASEGDRRAALVAAISLGTIVSLLGGLTWPLLSLRLDAMGYDGGAIGVSTAAQMLAILVAAPLVPRWAGRFGAMRLLAWAVAAAIAVVLAMGVWQTYASWLVLRFLLGACFEILFSLSDVWVVQLAPPERRGRVLAMFSSVSVAGYATGPLILGTVGFEGGLPFVVGAAVVAVAALPLWFARRSGPIAEGRASTSFGGFVRRTPTIMLAGAMYGFIDLVELSLFPVYAVRSGMAEKDVAHLLSVALYGSIAVQLGLGWLADRFTAPRVLVLCTVNALVCAVALPFAIDRWALAVLVMTVWSGTMSGFFLTGMMMMGLRYQGMDLVAANAVFVVMFGLGSMAGPMVGGAAMDLWDPHGMVATIAVACAAYLPLALFGRDRRPHGSAGTSA
jgi:MFS family permease